MAFIVVSDGIVTQAYAGPKTFAPEGAIEVDGALLVGGSLSSVLGHSWDGKTPAAPPNLTPVQQAVARLLALATQS